MYSNEVPLNQSALLVIDAQDSFKVGPRWPRRSNHCFEENVAGLIAAYRNAGLPIVYFLHTDSDEGFATSHPEFKLMDFIHPRPDEPGWVKSTRNCFTSTALVPHLLARNVRRVAISRIQTDKSCETSARVAADLGYAVDFVIDATMTFPIPNWDKPDEELGVDDIHSRTEYALRRRFARIVSSSQLISELQSA